ncbi:MAG: DUF115 domain-containing protein [Butyrivibrio sp.]|nr:DUF115 domain-containing protein [Butyrivibrio sp.]
MGSEIFEKNLAAMDKWYASFADMIRNEKYEKDDTEVSAEQSWDGMSVFRIRQGERTLWLNGRRNASGPVNTWLESLGEVHKYAPVFLVGLGSGAYLRALVDGTDESVNVIAYEPSVSVFLKMLEEIDLSEQIENRPIAFVVKGINDNELSAVTNMLMSLESVEYMKLAVHPNYRELFADDVFAAVRIIYQRYRFVLSNMNTGVNFSRVLAVNQMQNMRFVCDGYNTKGMSKVLPYKDRAAVLVSAGPSLNKNIQELKKAKNKAFIIAVDTALKPLFKEGIVPDAFLMIDAEKPLSLFDIDGIKDVPVVALIDANYEVIREQRGLKIFFNLSSLLPTRAYMKAGKVFPALACGGSVATSAFALMYMCGFETIILVGQDLALTGNKTHADGTFEEVMPQEDTSGMLKVKGNCEEWVPTRGDFKLYIEWFEVYIDGAKKHDDKLRVINATEGGAYIAGTEVMTLKEALEQTCGDDVEEVDFTECLNKMESDFTAEERKKAVDFLHSVPDDFKTIYNDAKKLYSAYRKINQLNKSGHINDQEYASYLKKVNKLSEKCMGNSSYPLISSTMGLADSIIRGASLNEYEDSEKEIDAVSKQGMKYAKLMQQCAKILEDYARETLLSIE